MVTYRANADDIVIPDVSLPEHVLRNAATHGDRPALIDGVTGETISYHQLDDLTARGAAGLLARGVRPGDVVAIVSHNSPTFAIAVHSVLRAGAVVTPLNPALTTPEIIKQFTDSKTKAAICSPAVADKVTAAGESAAVAATFVIGQDIHAGSFESLFDGSPLSAFPDLDPTTALAVLPYSSGTTGASKGVMLTHRNLVANLEQLRVGWRVQESDVICAALPFFHIYGFTIVLNSTLLAGGTVVTMPQFDLRGFLGIVEKYRVTRGHLAPPIVLALAHAPEVVEYDLSSLRTAISGAAPLNAEAAARAEKRTGIVIRQGYGMTEAAPGTHSVRDEDFETTSPGSVGRLLPGTEARIVDPATGEDVAMGERGELLVRGPQVMPGYLDNPVATASTVTDGWLHTGDIAVVDGDDFFIVDRLKELIKYKGYQIAPAELEAVLLTHPMVTDAAVIGIPHASGGEAPKAFVVTDGDLDPDELVAWVGRQVAPYKKIRAVSFVDAIPKSPAGKILRRVLKESEGREAAQVAR